MPSIWRRRMIDQPVSRRLRKRSNSSGATTCSSEMIRSYAFWWRASSWSAMRIRSRQVLKSLFQIAAGIAVRFDRCQRRDGHRRQSLAAGHCGAQGLEPAVDRRARLLLIALGIGDLAANIADLARSLDHRRELRDICSSARALRSAPRVR